MCSGPAGLSSSMSVPRRDSSSPLRFQISQNLGQTDRSQLRPAKPRPPDGNLPQYALEQYVSPPVPGEWDWTVVALGGRKGARRAAKRLTAVQRLSSSQEKPPAPVHRPKASSATTGHQGRSSSGTKGPQHPQPQPRKVRLSKHAAILLTLPSTAAANSMDTTDSDGNPQSRSLGEVVSSIRGKVSLSDYGISSLTPKRAATGGILYEAPGPDSSKADKLAEILQSLLTSKDIKVSRPIKMTEPRVSGLDDSICVEEIATTIAQAGDCPVERVRVEKISRIPNNRLGTVWIQCPSTAAKNLIDKGPLTIG